MVGECYYLAVGHLTIDDLGGETRLGGASAYGSALAAGLGLSACVVSVVGSDFPAEALDALRGFGVDLSGVRVSAGPSTRFRVVPGPDRVVSSLLSRAPPLGANDVSHLRARIAHVGPVAGEVPREVVLRLAAGCDILLIDLQGFLREFDPLGRVRLSARGMRALEGVRGVVHANAEEAAEATGSGDPVVAAEELSRGFGVAAVTLGGGGAVVSGGRTTLVARPPGVEAVDDVGAGDVFTAALGIAVSRGAGLREAARFAVAAASASTTLVGPRPISVNLISELETAVSIEVFRRGSGSGLHG